MMNQISPYQPGEIATPRGLTALISEWQYELPQRVDAQELSAETAKGYERGAIRKGTKKRHVREALTDAEVKRLLA